MPQRPPTSYFGTPPTAAPTPAPAAARGTFLSLRWYNYVFIVLAIIILLSFASILRGWHPGDVIGNIASGVLRTLLGFAQGVLEMLEKSPLFWALAILVLFPGLTVGVSTLVKMFRGHTAEGKSMADTKDALGLRRALLEEKIRELFKDPNFANLPFKEQLNIATKEITRDTALIIARGKWERIQSEKTAADAQEKALKDYLKEVNENRDRLLEPSARTDPIREDEVKSPRP